MIIFPVFSVSDSTFFPGSKAVRIIPKKMWIRCESVITMIWTDRDEGVPLHPLRVRQQEQDQGRLPSGGGAF